MSRAKRKKSRKRLTIGYMMPWLHDPAYRVLWSGVHDAACAHDVNLICFPGAQLRHPRLAHRNAIYDLATPETLDGLILGSAALASFISPEEFEAFYQRYRPLPMVSFQRALEGIPSVTVDNAQGMRDMVSHLVETHGCRRIVFIRGPEEHQEAEAEVRADDDLDDGAGYELRGSHLLLGGIWPRCQSRLQ